jgi:hypothetical protein
MTLAKNQSKSAQTVSRTQSAESATSAENEVAGGARKGRTENFSLAAQAVTFLEF